MEIERKWLLPELPQAEVVKHYHIEQFYVSTNPEVRLRKCVRIKGPNKIPYRMAIKGDGTIAREEIQEIVSEEFYEQVKAFVGKPAIQKDFYVFDLDGFKLEVSIVDDGEFIYAEIEFDSVEQAWEYVMPIVGAVEVTNDKSYKMKNYWLRTRT